MILAQDGHNRPTDARDQSGTLSTPATATTATGTFLRILAGGVAPEGDTRAVVEGGGAVVGSRIIIAKGSGPNVKMETCVQQMELLSVRNSAVEGQMELMMSFYATVHHRVP